MRAPLEHAYWPNVLLVVMTLFPGLINSTALFVLDPSIARDLGVAVTSISLVAIVSDATLAFGCVVAAEFARRVEGRRLSLWLQAASIAAALISAFAPNAGTLVVGHALQGLATGMLFIVALPPLVTSFPKERLPATMTVLVGALFGAGTLGPLIGGFVSTNHAWRDLFAANAVLAAAAFVLAQRTIGERPPLAPGESADPAALVLAIGGATLLFGGAAIVPSRPGALPYLFIAAGLAALAGLFGWERRTPHALIPVGKLRTPYAVMGAIGTIAASMIFTSLAQTTLVALTRLDGLSLAGAGERSWPQIVAVAAAAVIFGRTILTPYLSLLPIAGIACLTCAAAALAALPPAASVTAILGVGTLASFGAGLTITPGLFVTALSLEKAYVGRGLAMLQLYRLAFGYFAGPAILQALAALTAARSGQARALVAGVLGGAGSPEPELDRRLTAGFVAAMHGVFPAVAAFAALTTVALGAMLIFSPARLQRPDFAAFLDKGEPAMQSPPVPPVSEG